METEVVRLLPNFFPFPRRFVVTLYLSATLTGSSLKISSLVLRKIVPDRIEKYRGYDKYFMIPDR